MTRTLRSTDNSIQIGTGRFQTLEENQAGVLRITTTPHTHILQWSEDRVDHHRAKEPTISYCIPVLALPGLFDVLRKPKGLGNLWALRRGRLDINAATSEESAAFPRLLSGTQQGQRGLWDTVFPYKPEPFEHTRPWGPITFTAFLSHWKLLSTVRPGISNPRAEGYDFGRELFQSDPLSLKCTTTIGEPCTDTHGTSGYLDWPVMLKVFISFSIAQL